MFDGASSFNNNISSWDVSSVTYMQAMFRYASSFGTELCNWSHLNPSVDVSNMFDGSNCSIERCFKCPTGSPTANPTGSKTSKPTAKPTDDPTGSPTRSLTANWAKIVVTLNGDGTKVILKRKNTSKNEKWIITTK